MKREIFNNCGFCKVLLLVIFISYYSSLNLFYHAHLINGQVVYHSHPFNRAHDNKNGEGPSQSHHHNKTEFYYIQQLDKSLWEDLIEKPNLPELFTFPIESIIADLPGFLTTAIYSSVRFRAPPFIPA
jgi:hypothetical protein